MPFQSEKQRRFLWAEHPDIAKRWAHEYPNKKKLPMYAHENNTDRKLPAADGKASHKKAALAVLNHAVLANNSYAVLRLMQAKLAKYAPPLITKKSTSIIQYLEVPRSEKPVAAGDESVNPAPSKNTASKADAPGCDMAQKLAMLLRKHAVVLNPKYRPNEPANAGLDVAGMQGQIAADKQRQLYGQNPLPIGAQQAQAPAQPQAQAQPQQQHNVLSNQLTDNNLMGNTIGNQGPLASQNGKPTPNQVVDGNHAFGSANRAPGFTQHGVT